MDKTKLIKSLKNLSIFLTGSTFTHYYSNLLNSPIKKAQEMKDLNTNKALEEIDTKIDSIRETTTGTNCLGQVVNNITSKFEKMNLKDWQLKKVKSEVENFEESRQTLETLATEGSFTSTSNCLGQDVVKVLCNNISNSTGKLLKMLEEFSSSGNKLMSDFNLKKFYEFLDSLTLLQESAFLHILMFISLLLIVFNILGALFGNEIIKYFNLEKKYPSLTTFFKLRSTCLWLTKILFILEYIFIVFSLFCWDRYKYLSFLFKSLSFN